VESNKKKNLFSGFDDQKSESESLESLDEIKE
jgi:hypothetical protein